MIEKEKLEKEFLLPELIKFIDNYSTQGSFLIRHFLCHTLLFGSPTEKSTNNTVINRNFKFKLKEYNKCLRNKDFEGAIFWVEKPHKLSWFIKNYKRIYIHLGDKKYYSLLRDSLVYVNFHYYTKVHYHKLISIGKDPQSMMKKSERRIYDRFPDKFFIFRGICADWPLNRKNLRRYIGNSWTLDKKKAIWFSQLTFDPVYNPYPYLLIYEVSKSEVLSYFTDRKEKEIFVDHKNLDFKKIQIEELPNPPIQD